LSSSRAHQLLRAEEAREVPRWLSQLQEQESSADEGTAVSSSSPETDFQARLAEEVEILRWCIGWLEQLARGETVVVNLRAKTDPKTAWVVFDQTRVLRVLKHIAADLDELSGRTTPTENDASPVDAQADGIQHRRRLAEPEPELSSLSQREQRGCFCPTPRKGKISLMPVWFVAQDLVPKGRIGVAGNQSINIHD
jgi:hypothetical protein